MTLAEALIEKKSLTARVGELQARYVATVIVEEGEEPETPAFEILAKLDAMFARLEYLTVAINKFNNIVKVGDRSLMEAIAHRDRLRSEVATYRFIIDSIRQRNEQHRYGGSTIRMVVAEGVTITDFTKVADDLAQQYRQLDVQIQSANWSHHCEIDPAKETF